MSKTRIRATEAEQWQLTICDYQLAHPGPFRIGDVVDWALGTGRAELPRIDPKRILIRKARAAARQSRLLDPQGRKVRSILPAKVERQDENGNRIIDVVWDHIHRMSLRHALTAFEQRDENIARQRRSASRDLQSCLENNPHVSGHAEQFLFAFMTNVPEPHVVEEIEESPIDPRKPR